MTGLNRVDWHDQVAADNTPAVLLEMRGRALYCLVLAVAICFALLTSTFLKPDPARAVRESVYAHRELERNTIKILDQDRAALVNVQEALSRLKSHSK